MTRHISVAQQARHRRGLATCVLAASALMSLIMVDDAGAQAARDCLSPMLPDSTAPVIMREAISILADTSWQEMRTEHGIPAGSASDVSVVQNNAVCNAAMTVFEALTDRHFTEGFVIVRMGRSAPYFYLMTPRRPGALRTRYLLDSGFKVIDLIGSG